MTNKGQLDLFPRSLHSLKLQPLEIGDDAYNIYGEHLGVIKHLGKTLVTIERTGTNEALGSSYSIGVHKYSALKL